MSDFNWKGLLGDLATGYGQYQGMESAIKRAEGINPEMIAGIGTIGDMTSPYTTFKPFTVTTPTGTATTVSQTGLDMQLSPEQQQFSQGLMNQAMQQAGQIGSVTPESLMAQMSALRQPEQERAQLGLENRLAAQGRLGVQTAAYGGTPEQLAMQKAIQEQQSADALTAIQGARNLQAQDIGNIQSMFGLSNLPQEQAMQLLQPALQASQIGAGLQQTQANVLGNLGSQYVSNIPESAKLLGSLEQAQLQGMLGAVTGNNASGTNYGDVIGGLVEKYGGDAWNWVSGLFDSGISDGSTGGDLLENIVEGYDVNRPATTSVSGDASLNAMLGLGGGGVNKPPTITGPGGI